MQEGSLRFISPCQHYWRIIMSHHQKHHGLQQHSIGSEYPWTISQRGDTWFAFHCISGQEIFRAIFVFDPTNETERKVAYRCVEKWIANKNKQHKLSCELEEGEDRFVLESDLVEIDYTPPVFEPMQEYSFLVPWCAQDITDKLQSDLLFLFGGFTVTHCNFGKWLDDDGETVTDISSEYRVACHNYEKLVSLIRKLRDDTNQDCIYLAKTATLVKFI